jgi:hypothetical protein
MLAGVRSALLFGLACACHATSGAEPDAAMPPDAPPDLGAGLHVTWSTSPTIPGTTGNYTVSSMIFRVDSLSVIGDAGPGDPRTSKNLFELQWGDAGLHPDTIDFPDAPTGVYSQVTLLADGHLIDYSYEIYGSVQLSGVETPYKIHDRSTLTANITISTMLEPGGQAIVPLRVRVADALSVIDFTMLDTDAGVLELDTFDAQMGTFRDKLTAEFTVGDGTMPR